MPAVAAPTACSPTNQMTCSRRQQVCEACNYLCARTVLSVRRVAASSRSAAAAVIAALPNGAHTSACACACRSRAAVDAGQCWGCWKFTFCCYLILDK